MGEPRRRLRYTLGTIMAFIAGMAVMLAVLLPFVTWPSPRPAPVAFSHPGPMTAQGPVARQCLSCHAAPPKL
jgi:hypothetical protein